MGEECVVVGVDKVLGEQPRIDYWYKCRYTLNPYEGLLVFMPLLLL